jgi:CobQ-like glutamine amidotransferase family enzyme
MTEQPGRHASHDPGETLIIPAISGREEPEYSPPPPSGKHASGRPGADAGRGDQSDLAEGGDPAPVPAPDAGRNSKPPVSPSADAGRPSAGQRPPAGPVNGAGPDNAPGRRAMPKPSVRARRPPAADVAPAPASASGNRRRIKLVWVYPDLLSTYGDRGNLLVLARRAQLRGLDVQAIEVDADQPVPEHGDIYLLGGGEDLPQILAASRLRADGGLSAAADRGAVVFAVCAGYQLLGREFGGVDGELLPGLGILDITSGRGERRGVGEIVADVDPTLGVPRLTGFENHQGVTRIGPGARPLSRVTLGVGNGDGTEGAYAGKVLGTYLHGPALARNPGLADLLLSWAVGPLQPLSPMAEEWARQLRAERLGATASAASEPG